MYFEWHLYKVQGTNGETGRKKTIKLVAHDQESAETELALRGLLPPYRFTEEEFDMPTDSQMSYAIDLGIEIYPSMTRKDVSTLIKRELEPEADPSEDLMTYAYNKNIYFSPFVGLESLCNIIFNTLCSRDKAVFFCYAVYCSIKCVELGNLDESPDSEKFYEFGDMYAADESFKASLESYSGDDLITFESNYGASKRRKAYQLAANFLQAECSCKFPLAKKYARDSDEKLIAEAKESARILSELTQGKPIMSPLEQRSEEEIAAERKAENQRIKKVLIVLFVIFVCYQIFSSPKSTPTTTTPPPKVEEVSKKPEPPKEVTPENSYYAESYDAIRTATGMRVTERWMLSYSERLRNDGAVDTHGFVELNGDGVKRQFWLMFDDKTRKCLRVKIDGTLLYTAVGW